MHRDELSELIGQIYDCAVDPALWPTALEGIGRAMDSIAGALCAGDFVTGQIRTEVYWGLEDRYIAMWQNQYRTADVFMHGLLLADVDQPTSSDDVIPDEELFASRVFREWGQPQNFRYGLAVPVMKNHGRLAYLCLMRGFEQRRFDEEDKALLYLLAPHVRRSITIADLIGHEQVARTRFLAVVDALATPTMVLDGDGRLVHANGAAEALLKAGTHLVLRSGVVMPAGGHDPVAPRDRTTEEGRTLVLGDGPETKLATVLPLAAGRRLELAGGRLGYAVFVQDGGLQAPLGAEVIGKAYKLTGSELRVLLSLAQGSTLRQIADHYGLSLETVRSQLKSLFAKTGTRRQSELVKLVVSAAPVARPA